MLTRALTIALAAPLVIALIKYLGPGAFFLAALAVGVLALYEFYIMALSAPAPAELFGGIALGCTVLAAAYLEVCLPALAPGLLTTGVCVAGFIIIFAGYICFGRAQAVPFDRAARLFLGVFYVALLFSFIILLRGYRNGASLVLFLLFVTWAGDIGAYLVGKQFGSHPLCLRVSPKKTVEGSVGGALFGIGIVLLCRPALVPQLSAAHCIVLGAGINVMNQFGDLSESVIKRACGAKDSGALLPGHGGVLDRIDSILFAAPFAYYYVRAVGY